MATENEKLDSTWTSATQTEECYTNLSALLCLHDTNLTSSYPNPTKQGHTSTNVTNVNTKGNNTARSSVLFESMPTSFEAREKDTLDDPDAWLGAHTLPATLRMFLHAYLRRETLPDSRVKMEPSVYNEEENMFLTQGFEMNVETPHRLVLSEVNKSDLVLLRDIRHIYHSYLIAMFQAGDMGIEFQNYLCSYYLLRGESYVNAAKELVTHISSNSNNPNNPCFIINIIIIIIYMYVYI